METQSTGPITQYMTKCSECGRQAWTHFPNKPGVLCFYCEREMRDSMRDSSTANEQEKKGTE